MRKLTKKKNTNVVAVSPFEYFGASVNVRTKGPTYARGWLTCMTNQTIAVRSATKPTISRRATKSIFIGSPFYQQGGYWISGSPYLNSTV